MNHEYLFLNGGTGTVLGRGFIHTQDSEAYASSLEKIKIYQATMDAGSEELTEIRKIQETGMASGFRPPAYAVCCLYLAEKAKARLLPEGETMTLGALAPGLKGGTLFTDEQEKRDLQAGYFGDLTIGSLVSAVVLDCALETPEDKMYGFQAVVNDVLSSNGTYEVRVMFAGSIIGGEGRTNLSSHPAILKSLCIKKAEEVLHMQPDQAKAYVEHTLKIGVAAVADVFRFPEIKGLDQDLAGRVIGTLRNYPAASANAVNLFYLLAHDCCPVQASEASESGEQHKHAHAVELVAAAAIEDFFHRSTEEASKRQCPVLPDYSMPGRKMTNWRNLSLPEDYRAALSARLRFDAALIYWIGPQLILPPEERRKGRLYESEILARMFKAGNPRQLEKAMESSPIDPDRDIIEPLKALLRKESMFLKWLLEICLTGKNWETGEMPSPDCGTYLFEVSGIEHLLSGGNIRDKGGMTGFFFDDLTMCPADGDGNREDSLYHTKLTMDRLRSRITYRTKRGPRDFLEILGEVCDICSERKEKKHGIFK